jgi:Domain of unknown function (DUF3859)
MQIKFLAIALTTTIVACSSPVHTPSSAPAEYKVTVTEYGLFNRGQEKVYSSPASPSGYSRGSSGYRLATTTRQIPLKMGVSFGFCYEVQIPSNQPSPDILIEVEHPKMINPNGSERLRYQAKPRTRVSGPVFADCAGYGFDHGFELVPGTWRFTVLVGGTPQVVQEFEAQW